MEAIHFVKGAREVAKRIRNHRALTDYKRQQAMKAIKLADKNCFAIVELDDGKVFYPADQKRLDYLKDRYRWQIKRISNL